VRRKKIVVRKIPEGPPKREKEKNGAYKWGENRFRKRFNLERGRKEALVLERTP